MVQKPIFGDEHGKLHKAVGTRGIGVWVVPAVTDCGHGPRAREIAGWTGDHRGSVKSRLDSTGANLPRRAGFSWPYHHNTIRSNNVHVGGFSWLDLAGTSAEVFTFRRERSEPQMEVGKAGEDGGCVGAAQGNLTGGEIVEQGASALYLREVRILLFFHCAPCQLAAIDWHDRRSL